MAGGTVDAHEVPKNHLRKHQTKRVGECCPVSNEGILRRHSSLVLRSFSRSVIIESIQTISLLDPADRTRSETLFHLMLHRPLIDLT